MEQSANDEKWLKPSISVLEADIAYFEARLALLSEFPESYYQEAQIKAYKELETVLAGTLEQLKGISTKKRKRKKLAARKKRSAPHS